MSGKPEKTIVPHWRLAQQAAESETVDEAITAVAIESEAKRIDFLDPLRTAF